MVLTQPMNTYKDSNANVHQSLVNTFINQEIKMINSCECSKIYFKQTFNHLSNLRQLIMNVNVIPIVGI